MQNDKLRVSVCNERTSRDVCPAARCHDATHTTVPHPTYSTPTSLPPLPPGPGGIPASAWGQASAPISRSTLCEQWWLFNVNVSSVRSTCDGAVKRQEPGLRPPRPASAAATLLARHALAPVPRHAPPSHNRLRRDAAGASYGTPITLTIVFCSVTENPISGDSSRYVMNGKLAAAPHRMQRLMTSGKSRGFRC